MTELAVLLMWQDPCGRPRLQRWITSDPALTRQKQALIAAGQTFRTAYAPLTAS
jgi:hypothetical protein